LDILGRNRTIISVLMSSIEISRFVDQELRFVITGERKIEVIREQGHGIE